MTDHAKALADALCKAKSHIEHMAKFISSRRAGYSFESLGEDMPGINEALVAYDARSKRTCQKCGYTGHFEICPLCPQASGDLVARLRAEIPAFEKVAKTYERDKSPDPKGAWWRKMVKLLSEAADALSRAPQPDTVTEEMVQNALNAWFGGPDPDGFGALQRSDMRAALTAALSARAPK